MKMVDDIHRRLTASISFPLTNYLFNRRNIGRDVRELTRTQWMAEEQLQELQVHKLRRQLAYANKWVPFYRRQFREIGFDPRDVTSLVDFASIPALSRNDLRENHRDLVDLRRASSIKVAEQRGAHRLGKPIPFGRVRRHQLVKHSSSGSTGEPVVYYQDGATSAASWAFEGLFKLWYGVRPGPREVRLARLATEQMPSERSQSLRRLLWRQLALPGLSLAESDYASAFESLSTYRPEVLWGFTSALRGLGEFMVAEGKRLPYKPQVVVTWAEPVLEYEEEVLSAAFQCPVTNLYSSHEVGHIACRCPQGSSHVDQSHLLVESVDVDTEGVGELVVTMLFNSVMPLIRYEIGDRGRIGGSPCQCGRGLQVIESLHGRTYELFTTTDGRMISPNVWLHLFRRDHVAGFIKRFQVTYRPDKSVLIKVIREENSPSQNDAEIRDLVTTHLGGQTPVEWHYVDTITPEPSGKVPIVRFGS